MDLSRHFTLAELTFSRTAAAEGIDNTPTEAERGNLAALCTSVLDPLRDAAGTAIKVSSGYRGPALNRRIKGELKSQHLEGKAADIQPTSMTVLELFKTIVRLALPFDQLIYEAKSTTSKWVHISHDAAGNRGQIKVAHFLPTGAVERYEPITVQQALAMQEAVSRKAQRLDQLEFDEMADEPRDDEEPVPETPPARVEDRPVTATMVATKVAGKKARKTAAKTTRKTAAKKTRAKKTRAKKTLAKKTLAKKTLAKTTPAKKPQAKKTSAKKTPARQTTAKKTTANKATPKKAAAAKKSAAKKPSAKARKAPIRSAAKPAAKKRSRSA